VLLADDILKNLGTPFSGKNFVRHLFITHEGLKNLWKIGRVGPSRNPEGTEIQ
jgi:hypothetical protein